MIVGAGSAGCVLANRLTADGRSTVLLLEAGTHDKHFWIHVPLGYGKLFARTDVNWAMESSLTHAQGRRVFPPAEMLRGSSSITAGSFRGNARITTLGRPGWGFTICCRTSRV